MVESKEYMTVKETAVYLGLAVCAVYELIHAGDFPAVRFGRRWRVSKKRLESWVDLRLKWKSCGVRL